MARRRRRERRRDRIKKWRSTLEDLWLAKIPSTKEIQRISKKKVIERIWFVLTHEMRSEMNSEMNIEMEKRRERRRERRREERRPKL